MAGYKFPDEVGTTAPEEEIEVTMPGDTDVEVEAVDDTPPQDRGRKPLDKEVADPTDDEINSYSDKVQSRIKDLTHARHDERRAKEALAREKQELENFTRQLIEENKKLKTHVNTGAETVGKMATSAAEQKMLTARKALKEATEAFDTEAIITAQEALMEARIEVEKAKNFRPAPLQEENFDVQTRYTEPQKVQPDEKTLRWQAKNQWFGSNGFEEVTSFALGLHQKLVNSGMDPRSDEYFEQIDARVKSKFPEVFGGDDGKSRSTVETPKKPASVVAPATRTSGAKKVQLTHTQIALAKRFGLTPQQYAAQVAKLEN